MADIIQGVLDAFFGAAPEPGQPGGVHVAVEPDAGQADAGISVEAG